MDSRALQQALDLEFNAEIQLFISSLQTTRGVERNFRFRALREISETLSTDDLVRLAARLEDEATLRLVQQPLRKAAANA